MNGISGISNGMNWMQNMQAMRKPDPEEMAQQLFAELDTSGQGYLEKSDLQSALAKISSTSESSASSNDDSDLDELFSQLDSDGNGKITEQELSESLAYIDDQISNLFSQMRMNEAQQQMMPPPPPPPQEASEADDAGFTAEELTAQLEEIGDSDSTRSILIQNILANFDEADTDGDGRVNLQEAMAFDQTSNATSDDTVTTLAASAGENDTVSEKVMMQIMRLVQAYDLDVTTASDNSSTLNVST